MDKIGGIKVEIEDIPKEERKWIEDLNRGSYYTEDIVHDTLNDSVDITEFKREIVISMAEVMTECAQVIQHANAMKDDRICTCKEKCGE
jgi:hypothetical protein